MTYKQIEQCRETRMWIKDIVVPLVGFGGLYLSTHPEAKNKLKEKFTRSSDAVKSKVVDIRSKFKN